MWLGILHVPADEAPPDCDHDVGLVFAWCADGTTYTVAGPVGAAGGLVRLLRQSPAVAERGGTVTPRCDACGGALDLPDLDAADNEEASCVSH